MLNRTEVLEYLSSKSLKAPEGPLFLTGPDIESISHLDIPVCERPMRGSGYDIFSVHWTDADPACHYTGGQTPIITDIKSWRDEVKFPDVSKFDWEYAAQQWSAIDSDNNLTAVTLFNGPFERTSTLTSFENCLINAFMEPVEYSQLVGAIADFRIELIRKIASIADVDVINLHDDWGTSTSQFMSLPLWRETIKPHTKRLYDACREYGFLVCQHSCGTLTPYVADLVEMGADIWEAQPDCNDVPALRKEYAGKLCILETPGYELMTSLAQEGKLLDTPSSGLTAYEEKPIHLYN